MDDDPRILDYIIDHDEPKRGTWHYEGGCSDDEPFPGDDHAEARQEEQAPDRVKLHWHGEAGDDEDRRWLVWDTIPEVGKGLLSGQWGTAKTFAALDLAGAVMTRTRFAGRRVERQGGVLFIAPEGSSEIPSRLRGLVASKLRGLAVPHPGEERKAIDPAQVPFAWIDECPPLLNEDSIPVLVAWATEAAARMETVHGLPLAVIIIDTVATSSGVSSENDAAEGTRVMATLEAVGRKTGTCVIGVDHFGKLVETGTRGTSAKESSADVVLATLGERALNGTVSNLRMAVRKVRGGPSGMEIPFTLDVVAIGENKYGESVTTCTIAWSLDRAAQPPKAERWPPSLKVFRTALDVVLLSHGKRIRPFGGEGSGVLATTVDAVRAEFFLAYPTDGKTEKQRADAKKHAFKRATDLARQKGLIGSQDLGGIDYLWLVDGV